MAFLQSVISSNKSFSFLKTLIPWKFATISFQHLVNRKTIQSSIKALHLISCHIIVYFSFRQKTGNE